ncbi:TetR/AcrR family transcriptional regulator [Thermocatellispora tengchongensis]|uniref:TetR/AcrR family transcriptional regulator n=1 Tax=Thermocatellispora tengchongensis TaxID=1073253 RepID=UPI00362F2F43
MSGGPAAPQQERSRRSAQQILAAAVDVLTADGIADFTMSSVSELAGLSVGGVYGRFPNKQSLLREVKNEVLTELEEAIAERLAAVGESGGGPAEVLEAFVTGLSEHLYARTRLFAFVFLQSADDAVMRRRGFDFHQRMKDALRDALAPYPIEPAGPGRRTGSTSSTRSWCRASPSAPSRPAPSPTASAPTARSPAGASTPRS